MESVNLTTMTDEALIEHVRSRDKDAYSEVVVRYRPKLERYVRSFTRDEDVISDVVQETLIGAFVHLQNFNSRYKFSSWIYRIAHNIAMNHFSRRPKAMSFDDELYIADDNAMEKVEGKEIDQRVHLMLTRLPAEYASPLALHFLEGYSYKEIAKLLRCPIGTVGTKINRAKNLLKRQCKNEI